MGDAAEVYRRVVDAARDGLWLIDPDATTVFANPRLAELLGRDPDQLPGVPAYELLDVGARDAFLDYLARLDADGGWPDTETVLLRPDGGTVAVAVTPSPVPGDDGVRAGWLFRVTEPTDHDQAFASLRHREHLLAAAESIARIGSWEWDLRTGTVAWSDQLYRNLGVEPDVTQVTAQGPMEFIHPDDRSAVEATVEKALASGEEFSWEARIIRSDGEHRWVRVMGLVRRAADGSPVQVDGTAQDVTERVITEQQAAEATRRLFLLESMASAANQTNNLDEAIRLAALGVPEFTTWQPLCLYRTDAQGLGEVLDLSDESAAWLPDPDPALAERARLSRLLEVAPAPGHEDTHTLVALPVLLDGETARVIQLLADEVPPDENALTLLEQIAGQLGQVAHRDAAAEHLGIARDQAMEASRLKSEFLATMSHEIRTPMNGVIGLTDLLLRTDLDDQQRRLSEGLQSAGLTLLEIINDILDLSKIEAGKLEMETVDFDVRTVFEKTAGLLSGPAHDKGLELVVACHPDVPAHLSGDPGRLGQVLANLGSNAVKFTAGRRGVDPGSGRERDGRRGRAGGRRHRHRRRDRPRAPGAALRRLHPGRSLDHPRARRHRAWAWPSPGSWCRRWTARSR